MPAGTDTPYSLERGPEGNVTVRFDATCDQQRTTVHEKELLGVVETDDNIVCDLSATEGLASQWIRLLSRMAHRANSTGKQLSVVGARAGVMAAADVLGLRDSLNIENSE